MNSCDVVTILEAGLREHLAAGRLGRPFLFGLCGAQGSGKSTAAAALGQRLEQQGLAVALLSLDDLYLTREERAELARTVHPLFATRGVPGTHDIQLGNRLLDALAGEDPVPMPRFDKARDTRSPPDSWEAVSAPVDVIIFEGWCVGARPERKEDPRPVNALEREEDEDGRWRAWVHTRLAGDYQELFARIDMLALLAAPDFSVVAGWRKQQEHDLKRALVASGKPTSGTMDDAQVDRFIQHYQRVTETILREMPWRADLTIRLDAERRPVAVVHRPDASAQ